MEEPQSRGPIAWTHTANGPVEIQTFSEVTLHWALLTEAIVMLQRVV